MTRHAKTGAHINSDGQLFEWADWVRFQQRYDPQWQTVRNGASRFSGRRREIDQETYWVGIEVPEGRRLVVWSDALKLSENEYDIDIFDAPDGFTGGTEGVKRKLAEGDGDAVSSTIWFGVTPTNEATHELRLEDFIDTGNIQGRGRPTVSPTTDNTFQVLTQSSLIRITRQDAGQSYVLSYRAVVWEDGGST